MNPVPGVEELRAIAAARGVTLTDDEAALYHRQVVAKLRAAEEFMRTAIEEHRPELVYAARDGGHRPGPSEDRYNAWLWKCEIRGASDGPLAGKTVSFKDHVSVAGIPLTLGTYEMDGFVPDVDATIVRRVLEAGGTIVGKNSMNGPTSAWGQGVPSDYRRPLNPHNPSHLTGGSSSGSAAAVAGREVDIAFGGDQGGSIRIPAAYCGVYGLKPTFGLVSHFGIGFGSEQSFDHTGPMARHAADMASALDAVAGFDGLDPRQDRSIPARYDSRATLARGVRGLRIGILNEGFVGATSEVAEVVLAAVEVLTAAGATSERVSIPEHMLADTIHDLMEIEGQRAIFEVGFFGAFARTHYPTRYLSATYRLFHESTDALKPASKLRLLAAEVFRRRFRGTLYAKAQNVRATVTSSYDKAFAEFDILVMPTCLDVAPPYDPPTALSSISFSPEGPKGPRTRSTSPFNYTGHPALSVPCGKVSGLPVGMQMVARRLEDHVLLSAAYAYEHSVDWERTLAPSLASEDLSPALR